MPTITDWIMVIITCVYVIATILICLFNYRAAKATREQVAEAKRQYEEINRAFITYEFLYQKRTFYGIRFTNHGKKVANHVKIQFKQKFIDSIKEPNFLDILNKQKGKSFVLGIGQSYDIYFGSNEYHKNENKIPIEGQLFYEDDKESYCEEFIINVQNYATIFSVDSETKDLYNEIKRHTRELKGIKEELKKINKNKANEYCDKFDATDVIKKQT